MIEDLYDSAIDYGIDQEQFWHMTLGEIRTKIRVVSERRIAEFKQQLMLREFEAKRNAEYICCIFSRDATVRSYYDMFPKLFEEEIQADLDRQTEENKARFIAMSMQHNKLYEPQIIKEGGDIDG